PETMEDLSDTAKRCQRGHRLAIIAPSPRRRATESEQKAPIREGLERLAHGGEHYGVPKLGVRDRSADVQGSGRLGESTGERRQILRVIALADPGGADLGLLCAT